MWKKDEGRLYYLCTKHEMQEIKKNTTVQRIEGRYRKKVKRVIRQSTRLGVTCKLAYARGFARDI